MNQSLDLTNYSLSNLNVSTDDELQRYHEYMYGTLSAKIGYVLMLLIAHIIAPILILGIIIFEMKGGDPQKRNILNRLQSMALTNAILYCVVVGLCRFWRELFGLIDFSFMIWVECFVNIFSINFVFLFTEMTIIQYLHIVVWKRVKEIDDEFWSFLLNIATTSWSLWITLCEHIPSRMYTYVLKIMTADIPESLDSIRYITFILL